MPKKGETKSNAKPDSKRQRKYNSTAKAKKDRAARNKARREAIRDGRAKKGDGYDLDHKTPLRKGGSNSKSNLRKRKASANRADNGSKKGMKRNGKRS